MAICMHKKNLTERDICSKFLTPAVKEAGWDVMSQIREQVYFTKGRIIVRGKLVTRGKAKFADYILYYKPNIPIAVIEAKDNNHPVGGGMQQGLKYAATLDIPFVFSSNGDAFLFHDRTGLSDQTQTERPQCAGRSDDGERLPTLWRGDGEAQRISQLCWMFFLKIIDDQDQELELMQEGYRSPIPAKFRWRTWAADPEGVTGEELLAFVNDELFPALKELPNTAGDGRRRVVRDVFEDAYNYMKSGQLMRQVVNKITAIDFNNLSERQHLGDLYEQILNDLQSAGNAGEYYTPRAVEKKQLPHMLCVTNMLLHGIDDPSFVGHDNTLARPYISYGQADRGHRPHQSAVWRARGRRHREQLPQALPDPRDRRPVPRPHHQTAQARRTRRSGAPGRHPVWRRR